MPISPVKRIALRRIKHSLHKSIFLSISVFFSMFIVSFFAFFELHSGFISNPEYNNLPFDTFMGFVNTYMRFTSVLLILITALQIRIQIRLRGEENRQTLAVLTSVGASARQKRALVLTEIQILYLLPTVAGILIGILPGIFTANSFINLPALNINSAKLSSYINLAVMLLLLSFVLILFFSLLPTLKIKKTSVISEVKKQNKKASNEKHSYMQSRTFQEQALLKRLAQKSTKYYSGTYNGIALSFSLAALYPIIALILLINIGNLEIVLDNNPFDGVDTVTAVCNVVYRLMFFLILCFLVLTIAGFIQAVLTLRMQYLERRRSAKIYLTLGMPDEDIRKMITYEFVSLGIRLAVTLIFAVVFVNVCFLML